MSQKLSESRGQWPSVLVDVGGSRGEASQACQAGSQTEICIAVGSHEFEVQKLEARAAHPKISMASLLDKVNFAVFSCKPVAKTLKLRKP